MVNRHFSYGHWSQAKNPKKNYILVLDYLETSGKLVVLELVVVDKQEVVVC
jgi:hypothetical protein